MKRHLKSTYQKENVDLWVIGWGHGQGIEVIQDVYSITSMPDMT